MVRWAGRQAGSGQLAPSGTHHGLGLLDWADPGAPKRDPLIVTLVPAIEMDEGGLVLLVNVNHSGRVPLALAVLGRHLGPELRSDHAPQATHACAADTAEPQAASAPPHPVRPPVRPPVHLARGDQHQTVSEAGCVDTRRFQNLCSAGAQRLSHHTTVPAPSVGSQTRGAALRAYACLLRSGCVVREGTEVGVAVMTACLPSFATIGY